MKNWVGLLVGVIVSGVMLGPGPAIAGPQFLPYEGRNAIQEGQGGEKKTVDGVDFWFGGDPPHRFQVLGAISDRRMESGISGMIRMPKLEPDVAKVAREAGGDAVILQAEGDDTVGAVGFSSAYASGGRGWASGFGSSFAAPVRKHLSRYIVVKYLPDEPPPGPNIPAASAGPDGRVPPPPTKPAAASSQTPAVIVIPSAAR